MATDQVQFWLWVLTVATAVAGGVLSVLASRMQRNAAANEERGSRAWRLMMGSYVLMSVSILFFVVRGLV